MISSAYGQVIFFVMSNCRHLTRDQHHGEFGGTYIHRYVRWVVIVSYRQFVVINQIIYYRPISTFLQFPYNADRVFLTPFHAAWFVSLLTNLQNSSNNDSIRNLQSLELTIASKCGVHQYTILMLQHVYFNSENNMRHWYFQTSEDLSILLCSLLLGFGLNAFVALGSEKNANPISWVVTLDNSFNPLFWDPKTCMMLSTLKYLKNSVHYKQIKIISLMHIHIAKRFTPVTLTNSENDNETKLNVSKSCMQQKFSHIGCLLNNESFHCNIQVLYLTMCIA